MEKAIYRRVFFSRGGDDVLCGGRVNMGARTETYMGERIINDIEDDEQAMRARTLFAMRVLCVRDVSGRDGE